MKEEKKQLERLELSNKPTIIITQELRRQIDYLHSKIGNYEWSGELITSEEGTISDLDNWKVTAESIFLVDIGTTAFTGYEVNKGAFKSADVVELYDAHPGLLDGSKKNQHIHTHHSMNAFFSGTDWENLEDRAAVSNYFLMLIVNLEGRYCAKVAFKAKVKTGASSIQFANNTEERAGFSLSEEEKEVLIVLDCKVLHEVAGVSDAFEERYTSVRKAIDEEEKSKKKSTYVQHRIPYQNTSWQDDYDWTGASGWEKKDKKISDMTDKEWKEWEKGNQWQRTDFHKFMNSLIDRKITSNTESCIVNLERKEKKLKNTIAKENFLSEIEFNMRETFDKMFLNKDNDDYGHLISLGVEILESYDTRPLVRHVLELLEEELMFVLNESGSVVHTEGVESRTLTD